MSNPHPRSRRRNQVAAILVAGAVAGSIGSAGVAGAQTEGEYVAEYADALFERRGTELRLAPGEIDDQGTTSEVLEASVRQETCEGRFLVVIDVSASAEAADIPGVEVDAREGFASVSGTFTLTGDVTITPAGRGCATPIDSAATTAPLTTDVAVHATWSNARGSVAVEYSGAECGGNGACYYRDARAGATWASDFIGEGSARSTSGFLFEGAYPVAAATAAVIPSI